MGLDINPTPLPRPGHEAECWDLVARPYDIAPVDAPPPEPGRPAALKRRLTGPHGEDEDALPARIGEIGTPAHEAPGAPVVDRDPEADAWAKAAIAEGAFGTGQGPEAILESPDGYPALEALPDCDGVPRFSNAPLGGPDRSSFRGGSLKDCTDILTKADLDRAYMTQRPDELAAWSRDLDAAVRRFAAEHGIERAIGVKAPPKVVSEAERQVQIVDASARWGAWWSARGHGAEPDFQPIDPPFTTGERP